jgi:hypothetical protein
VVLVECQKEGLALGLNLTHHLKFICIYNSLFQFSTHTQLQMQQKYHNLLIKASTVLSAAFVTTTLQLVKEKTLT